MHRERRLRHGFQNHRERHGDDALQLLLPKRVRGRRRPGRGARAGRQWGLLRDNSARRGQRPWHCLQDRAVGHDHDVAQLQRGRRRIALLGSGPGYRRGFLRDNQSVGRQRLRDGVQNHFKWNGLLSSPNHSEDRLFTASVLRRLESWPPVPASPTRASMSF